EVPGQDFKTFESQGYELYFSQARGLIMPPDLTEAQRAYWSDALDQLVQTDGWAEYLDDEGLSAEFHFGDDAESYVEDEFSDYEDYMSGLGLESMRAKLTATGFRGPIWYSCR